MSRLLGSFMDDNELDRPDLNKCPDCECYFPQDNCPICGKECPEHMRAGKRKAEPKKKSRNGRSTAVQYVDWYHRWWFLILMFVFLPLVGIILLAGSPRQKWVKVLVITLIVVGMILSYFGIGTLYTVITEMIDQPVDTSLSYEEYIGKCQLLSGEDYYRQADKYEGDFVTITLKVKELFTDYDGYYNNSKYCDYLLCEYTNENGDFEIIIRECVQKDKKRYIAGDSITIYGECAGNVNLFDVNYKEISGPSINAAYIELNK
jgi:hypothetical protein